jgi:hypothetical protein
LASERAPAVAGALAGFEAALNPSR